MSELYNLIRASRSNSLKLLTLTACETAVGSDRDVLGIAGLSLQAGARSIRSLHYGKLMMNPQLD